MLIPRSLRHPGFATALVLLSAAVLLVACASPSPVPDRSTPEIQTTATPPAIAPVTPQPDPLARAQEVLTAYTPAADARPVVRALVVLRT